DALDAVRQSKLRGSSVALLLADQRMPSMNGVEFLEEAIGVAPDAKRALLTAYADTQAAIDAINRVSLDHYLLKPWDPPEEQLYPVVDDLLDAWRAEAPPAADRIQLVGHRWSRESHGARSRPPRATACCRWCCSPMAARCTGPPSPSWRSARACCAARSGRSTT